MFSLMAATLPVASTFFRAPLASTSTVIGNSASPVREMLVEGAFVVTSGVMVNFAVRTATVEATGLKTMLTVQVLLGAAACSVPLMQLLAPAAGGATVKSAASFPVIWSAGGMVPRRVIAAPVRFVTVTGTWVGVTATTAPPRSATGVGVTSMPIFLPTTTKRSVVTVANGAGGMMLMTFRTVPGERVTADSETPSPTKPSGGAGTVCWGNVLMLSAKPAPRARLKLMGGAAAAGMSRVNLQRTPAVGQLKVNSPQKCCRV